MSEQMFFGGWAGLERTLVVGILAYASLVLLLRISGKRTLAKMNAFDLVVTVALGSILGTVLLSKDVALAERMVAFLVLVGLQYLLARLSSRSERFQGLVKSEPSLLVYQGLFLENSLLRKRVAKAEALAAIRSQGIAELREVEAVVLETDGTFSVGRRHDAGRAGSLCNVDRYPPGSAS